MYLVYFLSIGYWLISYLMLSFCPRCEFTIHYDSFTFLLILATWFKKVGYSLHTHFLIVISNNRYLHLFRWYIFYRFYKETLIITHWSIFSCFSYLVIYDYTYYIFSTAQTLTSFTCFNHFTNVSKYFMGNLNMNFTKRRTCLNLNIFYLSLHLQDMFLNEAWWTDLKEEHSIVLDGQ